MKISFKMTRGLMQAIRSDLRRPHRFAYERVGFIGASMAYAETSLLVLARDYRPVDDNDYLEDSTVGAMMGPEAIRKALQVAMREQTAMIHVHLHGGRGIPFFSDIDLREQARFVPSF